MKKLLLFTLPMLLLAFVGCDDDDKLISENDLPKASKTFIETHFPNKNILSVEKDRNSYDVYLSDGYQVEFTRSGNWDDVEGIWDLPESVLNLLPQQIISYAATNFSNVKITEINKETFGYEIGLSNDIDLKFNKKGEILGIDN